MTRITDGLISRGALGRASTGAGDRWGSRGRSRSLLSAAIPVISGSPFPLCARWPLIKLANRLRIARAMARPHGPERYEPARELSALRPGNQEIACAETS